MTLRRTSLLAVVLAALLLLLALSWPSQAESPLSPRANPELRALMSGVVVVDPSLESPGASVAGLVPLGPNVLCNQDAGSQPQNEPSIAVNPQNPNHIVASSNDYRQRDFAGDVQPGYYVSFDGGVTWPGDGVIDLSPIPQAAAGGDPALAIHDMNNVYYAYIAFHRTIDDVGGVFVSKSTDGGLSWADPVTVALNTLTVFHDKEYIAVDASGNPYDGNVYVTWTRFEYSSPIYFSRSTDGGASYSTPVPISDYSSNQGSIPAVGPNGELYVVWYNYNTSAHRMAVSTNGGQSFGPPFHVAYVNPIPSPLPGGSFRDNSFPTLAVDQNSGNLYVAWNDYSTGDADILFVRSTNGGQTWSSPLRLNDDPLGNDYHQFFPWLTVAPDGTVYAGWFDSRNDPTPYSAPFYYDEYVTASSDGGLTWSPNARVSTQSADSGTDFSGQFIGDYSGIAANNSFVYPAWVDTRRGYQDIFTQANPARKLAPAATFLGQVFTYTVVLHSPSPLADGFLLDPLPAEVSYVPGSLAASAGSYGQASGVVTWTGSLNTDQPVTLTWQVTATGGCGVQVTNQATFTNTAATVRSWPQAETWIEDEPDAGFSPSAWTPSLGEVVTFSNDTEGAAPLAFLWSFGDGLTSTLPAPTHTYSLPGPYTVILTATDACGSDTHAETLTVVCDAPAAAFTWDAADLEITFSNESSGAFPPDFAWDFGDGQTSTETAPVHIYELPGTYTVSLAATDLCGTGVYSEAVAATCQAPTAAFTWTAEYLAVTFTSQSSGTFEPDLLWDFGDGLTSTLPAPVHTYAAPGAYTVTLTATDPCGADVSTAVLDVDRAHLIYLPLIVKN